MESTANGELIPQGGGDSIPLVRSPLILGRRESCDVCLQFANVSGKHCELIFKEGFWIIHDLGSTNGTKVNELVVSKKIVRSGDIIKIGQRNFTIQYQESGVVGALEDADAELANAISIPLLEKAGIAHAPRYPKQLRQESGDRNQESEDEP